MLLKHVKLSQLKIKLNDDKVVIPTTEEVDDELKDKQEGESNGQTKI